ncbi:helix-turn-helix domain-containing protein [Hymenobacter rigui]|uniref:AraC family transcriptional regulator n=1 Tax=Hymenobacter rigui TaxID=334424 RepID=A0A3R9MRN9_9BACT|nr:helix-turn-helix domain-containing protein [Hymenobacter rigui]RSK46867.1 AraC family transcriptional regulator [Hymenobacter rigui]
MFVQFYPPAPALQPLVQHYLLVHVRYAGEGVVKPFPPAPEQCLYFYPRDPVHSFSYRLGREQPAAPALLVGPQLTRVDLRLRPDHLMLRVAFRPGGLHRLLGVPMTELLDFGAEADLLLGPDLRELTDQLRNPAASYAQLVSLVEAFLLRRQRQVAAPAHPFERALPLLLHPGTSLDDLARAAGLSARQLERCCHRQLGVGPRLFARIGRFSRAVRLKDHRPDLDWLSVALLTGYSDYRHLVRDSQEFAGVTPPALLRADATHPARVYTMLDAERTDWLRADG